MNFPKNHPKHKIFISLAGTLTIFLIVLTVSSLVDISNKIKEGKYIGQEIESKNTLAVSGKGEIYAKPDLALTSFSVITEKKTVAQAMSENTKKMNKLIEAVKDTGVKEEDLKTIDFNIYPRYEYRKELSIEPGGSRVLVGYEVRQSLQVKIRDMDKIGEIIQEATEAGANQVGNLQFTVDKQDELKEEAREEAIKQAREKARKIASQLGVDLVRVTGFNESSQMPRYYDSNYAMKEMGMGGGDVELPQIETGENKIEVNVSVVYEIN